MILHDHTILNAEQLEQFIQDPDNRCPICGESMTQKPNPIRSSDSWWYTCLQKHAVWIGK